MGRVDGGLSRLLSRLQNQAAVIETTPWTRYIRTTTPNDPNLEEHFDLSSNIIDNLEPPQKDAALLKIGSYLRDWCYSQYGINENLVAENGVTIHVYHMPHPDCFREH